MKANELRVGNFIQVVEDKAYPYYRVSAKDIVNVESNMFKPDPIQLTEEWLLKFGFESDFHDQVGTIWNIGHFQIIQNLPHLNPDFGISLNGINAFTKYVHQLQNLYFALTGEELTLNG